MRKNANGVQVRVCVLAHVRYLTFRMNVVKSRIFGALVRDGPFQFNNNNKYDHISL